MSGTVYGVGTDVTTVSKGIELLRNLPILATANPSEVSGGSVVQSLTTSRTGEESVYTIYPVFIPPTLGELNTRLNYINICK